MVRRIVVLGLIVVAAFAFAGCTSKSQGQRPKLRVVASTYPIYLFTRQVMAGEPDVSVELLVSPNVGCPHDYMLTPQDMQRLADADVLVINGLGMEAFLGDAIKQANPKLKVIDSSAGIEELLAEHGDSEAGEDHGGHHHEHGQYNPHLFADPRMAARVVRNIGRQLSEAYPDGREMFMGNADMLANEMEKLGEQFRQAGLRFQRRAVMTQHDVFDYLARAAGLTVVATVQAEPGEPPSAARMLELSEKIKSAQVAAVFVEPQYAEEGSAAVVAQAGGVPVLMLDPVSSGPPNPPSDYYLAKMRENLATLIAVLGQKKS